MPKLLLQTVALTIVFLLGVSRAVVLRGHYLAPAVPIEVSDVSFPTVGPAAVAVSLVATVGADGRVSDTELVDSAGSTLSGSRQAGTLVGYLPLIGRHDGRPESTRTLQAEFVTGVITRAAGASGKASWDW